MSRIVLIGAPGSGKTSVGKVLSKYLDLPFIDTDAQIEVQAGKKITDIFVEEGEEFFRTMEFETLKNVLQEESAVISLGGGAPISLQAQKEIRNSHSIVIFLDVTLATAAPRVGFNRDRPLLLGNPRAQWQALSDKRRPIYEDLATYSIKVENMSVDEIAGKIKDMIS